MNRPCLESPIKRQYLKNVQPFCFHQFASDQTRTVDFRSGLQSQSNPK
jgi:hypothetical protein